MNIKVYTSPTNTNYEYYETSFDLYGSMYLNLNNCAYQLCVDNKNKPYFDLGDYKILDGKTVLFGSILDMSTFSDNLPDSNYEDSDDENSDYEYNDDPDPFGTVNEKYFPEEKDYLFSVPAKNHMKKKFYFCKLSDNINIQVNNRNNGDINALYDTFIYQDNKCKFRSKLLGEPPLYVLRVYEDRIEFRNIYDTNNIQKYNLSFVNENIILSHI